MLTVYIRVMIRSLSLSLLIIICNFLYQLNVIAKLHPLAKLKKIALHILNTIYSKLL